MQIFPAIDLRGGQVVRLCQGDYSQETVYSQDPCAVAGEFAAAKMVCIVENLFEDGPWAILEWRDPLGLRGCGFFRVEGGKIAFQRGYWDKLSFLKQHGLPIEQQTGLTPPPPSAGPPGSR